mmetsp:Transcript_10308/g.29201  ORF Transcript_10308/g.29201 Transcript_10308/m.29201 type:complete len:267 (-) Transcript_10308:240-1040(-)
MAVHEWEEPGGAGSGLSQSKGSRPGQGGYPEESLVLQEALVRHVSERVVEAQEDGDGGKGRQAAGQGVYFRHLVQTGRLHVDPVLVVPEPPLDAIDGGLQLHRRHAHLRLLLRQRVRRGSHKDGKENDGKPVGIRHVKELQTVLKDPQDLLQGIRERGEEAVVPHRGVGHGCRGARGRAGEVGSRVRHARGGLRDGVRDPLDGDRRLNPRFHRTLCRVHGRSDDGRRVCPALCPQAVQRHRTDNIQRSGTDLRFQWARAQTFQNLW